MHPILVIFIWISTEINSSFQWHSWFSKLRPGSIFPFRIMHMHRISHPAYHTMFCIMLLVHCTWLIVSPFVCVLVLGRAGRRVPERGPVEYADEDQAYDNSENLAGKMTTPRNHFYLCYASCSLYCHARYLSLAISCLLFSAMSALTILS